MTRMNYNRFEHFSLLKKTQMGLVETENYQNDMIKLNELRDFVYNQFAYNSRDRYLSLVEDCIARKVSIASALLVLIEIRTDIKQELADFEAIGESLEEFQLNPKSKDFEKIDSNLFGLFEFCYDPIYGITEEEVMNNLPIIRDQILAYE